MLRRGAVVLVALATVAGAQVRSADVPPAGLLLVVNKGDHTLGIIDPVAGRQVATVRQSGVTGHEVIASPDGKTAYVPIYGDAGVGRAGSDGRTLDVIDIAARRLVATIDLGAPQRPHCPVFGPDGRLYVTAELTNAVKVIDPRTNTVVDTLPTEQRESHMLVLSADGRTAYTSNVGAGTVSVIDVAARKVKAVITVAARAQRIALSADGTASSPPTRTARASRSSTRGRTSSPPACPSPASPTAPLPPRTGASWSWRSPGSTRWASST